MKCFLGIDPGRGGGIARIAAGGVAAPVHAWPMPETEGDLWELLYEVVCLYPPSECLCLLERAQAFPGQGISSAFNYGLGYGALRMALLGRSIPFQTVTSPTWQKALRCLSKGDKRVTRARAQELYPYIRVTHRIADALLIATYAQRKYGQILVKGQEE